MSLLPRSGRQALSMPRFHMGPRDCIHIFMLANQAFYLQNHFPGSVICFFACLPAMSPTGSGNYVTWDMLSLLVADREHAL